MNRIRTNQAIFASLMFGLLSLAMASDSTKVDYAPSKVDMALHKVSEHIYYVQGEPGMATDNEGFISNAGFVVTGEGVVVFDSLGTPSLAVKLLEHIREVTDEPVVKVVLSHYHADHIYGLQVFEDLGAEVIAPSGVYKYLESHTAKERLEERRISLDPWVNDDTRLVLPDRIIETSETFQLGNVTFVINYQGAAHSDGDLAMYVEPDEVLFSGDLIFEGRIPFVGNADTKHWLGTLTRMETQGLDVLIPGHGPASSSPADTISLTRKYLAFLREKMGTAVEEFQPFAEVYNETDWSEFEDLPAFKAGNRINAYQVYLSMEAEMLAE